MEAEVDVLKERARRAYERGRMRSALLGALPVIAITVIAGFIDRAWSPAVYVGPLLFVAAAFLLFRGRQLGRAVLPGVFAGIVPFVAIQIARASGHVCTGAMCFSACIPACAIGGVVAGVVIARVARRSSAPLASWASGGVMAALTGALGCACIGVFGVVGLVMGILVGSVPLVIRPAFGGARS